ncbi:MAG: hypothetical protein JSR71_07725 [Proteobacteria bacterium]|nr:hypothetical protein [Pseudomonadota bacterium]
MNYAVSIKQSALKSLKIIVREDRLRIIEAIDQFKTKLATGGALKGECLIFGSVYL